MDFPHKPFPQSRSKWKRLLGDTDLPPNPRRSPRPTPSPLKLQMTQVAKECFPSSLGGGAVMAVPPMLGILAPGYFRGRKTRAWGLARLGPASQPGSVRWTKLINTSQVYPALLQEAFLTHKPGSEPSSGTMPVTPTHLGLWLPTTDFRTERTWPGPM